MEKKDIALKQLRAAAKLYKEGDYISSITLAGAAEEILGRIAEKRTGSKSLENEILYLNGLGEFLGKGKIEKKKIINVINKTKNELKHNDSGVNNWVDADFENEAVLLFVKAVKNYLNAYNEMPKDRVIVNLFEHLTL